jgi:tRNA pseudouridine55 synthase
MTPYFGAFNIDKPRGMTSRDVVNRIERLVRPVKAGHAGTLDPLATGVLVVCVGAATRLIEYVQDQPKQYEATFLLGRRSDTDDMERTVEELHDPPIPTREQIEAVLPKFLGTIEQRPPAFSAIKVGGRRAYKLARAGKTVELVPRQVRIDELTIRRYAYPQLEVAIVCGGGTYVRSLGRDLAAAVNTWAVMSELCRTAVGQFTLDAAARLEDLNAANIHGAMLPPELAVAHLPRLVLTDQEVVHIGHGRFLERGGEQFGEQIAAFDATGRLVAILAADLGGRLRPVRNSAPPS